MTGRCMLYEDPFFILNLYYVLFKTDVSLFSILMSMRYYANEPLNYIGTI